MNRNGRRWMTSRKTRKEHTKTRQMKTVDHRKLKMVKITVKEQQMNKIRKRWIQRQEETPIRRRKHANVKSTLQANSTVADGVRKDKDREWVCSPCEDKGLCNLFHKQAPMGRGGGKCKPNRIHGRRPLNSRCTSIIYKVHECHHSHTLHGWKLFLKTPVWMKIQFEPLWYRKSTVNCELIVVCGQLQFEIVSTFDHYWNQFDSKSIIIYLR